MFSNSTMSIVEVASPKDLEIVEYLLLDLLDPENKALSLWPKVATFIVQKIMLDEVGLQYICATPECFFPAASVSGNMVGALTEQPSTRLLKHVICCYLRLTDDPRTCIVLRTHLPEALRNGTFDNCLRDDPVARHFLQQLMDIRWLVLLAEHLIQALVLWQVEHLIQAYVLW